MGVFIETKLAEYINTVASTKRIKVAAEQLGVRYQTISQSISRLENSLNIKDLFVNVGGILEPNPDYEEIFNICYQMVALDQRAKDIASNKSFSDSLALFATQTLNEAFFVPYYPEWMKKHPNIILKLKEDDNLCMQAPKFNEVTMVSRILDDQSKYEYFPFHNFRQKLWASKKYIETYGPFNSVEDLSGNTFLLQKVTSRHGNISSGDKEILGYRGIIDTIISTKGYNIKLLDIDGIRTIDALCEKGVGIMPAAAEPLILMKRPVENILPGLYGDDISVHVKVRTDSLKKSTNCRKLVNFIFSCRDKQFEKIGANPLYQAPKV